MGNQGIVKKYWPWVLCILVVVVVGLVANYLPLKMESEPTPNPAFDNTILILKASPVENVPGQYILEYSNGHVELLYADGRREALAPIPKSELESHP